MKAVFAKFLQITIVTLVGSFILTSFYQHQLLLDSGKNQSSNTISIKEFKRQENVDRINLIANHDEKGQNNIETEGNVIVSGTAKSREKGAEKSVTRTRFDEELLAKGSEGSQIKTTVSAKRSKGVRENISPTDAYDPKIYDKTMDLVTKSFSNETTGGQYFSQGFWGGFVNQYQMFTAMMILAEEGKHRQLLLESIRWKDTHGTKAHVRHELLFDVVHWNSFYPVLPRFVRHDPVLHSDVSVDIMAKKYHYKRFIKWKDGKEAIENATNVFPLGLFDSQYSNKYGGYTRDVRERKKERKEWDKVMTDGAFRPHPEMQMLIDKYLDNVEDDDDNVLVNGIQRDSSNYIMLHARIEPDMQQHPMCLDRKVTNLTDILASIQEHFPKPPAEKLILALDRRVLENGADDPENTNELQKYNLKVLNEIGKTGLWGGRVRVMEAGVSFVETSGHPVYTTYPNLVGSIVDFFLAQNAKMFIGTEVSSWSNAVIRYRFYKNRMQNYVYRPGEIVWDTPEDTPFPQVFFC
jgi:hypothetical protein